MPSTRIMSSKPGFTENFGRKEISSSISKKNGYSPLVWNIGSIAGLNILRYGTRPSKDGEDKLSIHLSRSFCNFVPEINETKLSFFESNSIKFLSKILYSLEIE